MKGCAEEVEKELTNASFQYSNENEKGYGKLNFYSKKQGLWIIFYKDKNEERHCQFENDEITDILQKVKFNNYNRPSYSLKGDFYVVSGKLKDNTETQVFCSPKVYRGKVNNEKITRTGYITCKSALTISSRRRGYTTVTLSC